MKRTKWKMLLLTLALAIVGAVTFLFAGCGSSANVTENYYYKVAFNHMSGSHMGVDLSDELIRTEAESLVLYDDNTFVITFASSLVGTISPIDANNPHETGYVYAEQMYESAVLTGTYEVKSVDDLMHQKVITLTSFTALLHNNVAQNLEDTSQNEINFTAEVGCEITVNTETTLLSEFFEFYEGQYVASNTSY